MSRIKSYRYLLTALVTVVACASAARAIEDGPRTAEARMRAQGVAKQFPEKLRLVVAGPGYMWGIDEQIKSELAAAGIKVLSYPDVPMIDAGQPPRLSSWEQLRQYNVLIFGDQFYAMIEPDPATGRMPKAAEDMKALLDRFIEEGGGVFFSGLAEYDFGKSAQVLNYFLKDLNARAFPEPVKDAATLIPRSGPVLRGFCWTDAVNHHPLTEGVTGLWYPFAHADGGGLPVIPVEVGPQWRPLVNGLPTAASHPLDLKGDEKGGKLLDAPGAIKSSPTLVAVREYGKGRVVLWPMWSEFSVLAGSHPGTGQMVLAGEHAGRKSDGARLIENLLCWLAEPSQGSKTIGRFDPQAVILPKPSLPDPEKDRQCQVAGRKGRNHYKGLIGAHSNLSDGQSSPAEMIATAKKAGYDFIAFTEDLAQMNREKWNQLWAVCDQANATNPGFMAYAGLDFLDDAGNRGVLFGQRWWPPQEGFSAEHPGRLKWWYALAYMAANDTATWPPRIIIRSKTNNKRPWNQGLWSFFAAYCYEGGKLVDDSFAEWRQLIGPHVFHMNAGLVAVHTVRTVEEVTASARPGLYQTYIRADNPPDILVKFSFIVDFFSYISAGPTIEAFETYYVGDWEGAHLNVPGNHALTLHIRTRAEAGLKEVQVYDGVRLVRRFRPAGNEFETSLTLPLSTAHCYSMTVVDQAGQPAVSWSAYAQILERVHRRCGDNYNWMRTGKGRISSAPGPLLHEALPLGTRAPYYFVHQGARSHGGLPPASDRYIMPEHMNLQVDGKPWDACYPAIVMDFATVGRYGEIVANVVREDYLVREPVGMTVGAFTGPYAVVPSPWPARLTQYLPEPRFNGMEVSRYVGEVTFTNTIGRPEGKPITLSLGGSPSWDINPAGQQGCVLHLVRPDGSSERFLMSLLKDDSAYSGEIPAGGYLAIYGPDAKGLGAVLPMSPGVKYNFYKKGDYSHFTTYLELPNQVEPGTKVRWDVLFANDIQFGGNSCAPMEDLRRGLGLAGKPTLYKVRPRRGRVADQKFFLTLESAEHGFAGKIARTTEKLLPTHLPVFIKGLNPRWDAGIWYRGQTRLEVVDKYRDPWGVSSPYIANATYEPRVDELQWIPILDGGVGYCLVDTDQQAANVFIGNFLVCDQPEAFLGLVKAERGKCVFEINNPTDEEIACRVRPARGFGYTGNWTRTITLAPGEQKVVSVP